MRTLKLVAAWLVLAVVTLLGLALLAASILQDPEGAAMAFGVLVAIVGVTCGGVWAVEVIKRGGE